jgi:hypothetical protein
LLAPQHLRGVDFSKQVTLLEQAAEQVLALVQSMRKGVGLEQIKDLNDKLQFIEGEADKAVLEVYRDLYNGKHDAIKVIAMKDLYDLLEKVIDRCRDAGNVIANIALKNS